MNEELRNEIVQRRQAGASIRAIARALGIARGTVSRVLKEREAQRSFQTPAQPRQALRRARLLDPYEAVLKELLERYPNLTSQRVFEELKARGFTGKYTIVRLRVRQLRPRPTPQPVIRFETGPGLQAQMDYGVYDLDFTREGRRRVYLFSYLLSYSRRQYLRFVEAMDLQTTIREHIRAFPIWAAWRGPACTTTSRWWCCVTTPTGHCTTRSSWPSPRTTALRHGPAESAGHRPRARSNAAFTTSRPTCSMAAPSTPWSISTR